MKTCNGDTHTLAKAIKGHETRGTHIESEQTPLHVAQGAAFIGKGLLHLVQTTDNIEIQWIHAVVFLTTAAGHCLIVVGDLQIVLSTIATTARILRRMETFKNLM